MAIASPIPVEKMVGSPSSANQGSQFRFHCSEFCFFYQNLTFILLNLKPKSQTFRTEIRIPVFTENEKNHRNFGLSDRKGEPCV